jgi:ketopantoate reductase
MMECPGVVVHTGPGSTYLGADDDNTDMITSDFLVHVADLMSRAGLSAQVRNDVDAIVWQKITVNAALNTLTAVLRYVLCMDACAYTYMVHTLMCVHASVCVRRYACEYSCYVCICVLCMRAYVRTRCWILIV